MMSKYAVSLNIAQTCGEESQPLAKIQIFEAEAIEQYKNDLIKSYQDGEIDMDELQKGLRDLTQLRKQTITNKAGKQQTVYVRIHPDTGKEHSFTHGDHVKFEHKGQSVTGHVKSLKHHEKFDPFGTAEIHGTDGKKYSKSLRAIEHHTEATEGGATTAVSTDKPVAKKQPEKAAEPAEDIEKLRKEYAWYDAAAKKKGLNSIGYAKLHELRAKIDAHESANKPKTDSHLGADWKSLSNKDFNALSTDGQIDYLTKLLDQKILHGAHINERLRIADEIKELKTFQTNQEEINKQMGFDKRPEYQK